MAIYWSLARVALMATASNLASGTVSSETEWLLAWRYGKKTVKENGLHYLINLKQK